MADFVVSLLDEATRAKEAKILFSCLADDPIWAERLVRGVQSPSIVRRNGCIEIIYSVLVRSIQVPFQDMFANTYASEKLFDKVESHLEPIETEFGKHLRCFIPDLCNVFIGSKSGGGEITLPGYTLPCSFTVARLWLLDSVYHCLSDVKEDPSLLELIPEAFWTTLVDSFFHFRFNNAFHVQFYKIFRVVLYSEQAAVYNRFFVNTNLVSRLIEHYMAKSQPTGSKGYIILILNCIRLSADVEKKQQEKEQKSQEDGDSIDGCNKSPLTTDDQRKGTISPMFWTDLIRSNPEWEDFQETLRTATLEQTRDTLCHMDPNLRFQFAPLQSRQPNETPLTRRHFGIPGVSARGNDGIDLGSKYGNSLGFGVPMKYDHEAAEKDKEKTEQDQESRVQKALANLMPTMDWKLIPPQRVLNAMGGGITRANAPGKLKQLQTNGHNTSSASAVAISPMNNNSNNDITASTTNVNGNTSSSTTPNGTSTSTSAKSKKKKKNKKKRPNSIDHTEDHFDSADSSEQTNGVSSSSSEEMVNDSGSSSACSSDDDESSSATSFEKNYVVEHPESNGNGPESTTTTTMDIDEERRERKREKNRQKKWKYKMNKKNKIHQLQAEAEENVGETGSAMEQ
ncbi:hypothetical protein BCR41DRAFT_205511 [Lobosporangium transversale]|uniref:Uncharacterized protein n=1 Tax=Lobosporangium transversale TaxID=64571 RepID=A0A1Y2GYC3_9FUNG|nr:hypothetical protein BCR41DRAFT_205511 [Lobosporangium transversale]ORZ26771.1 hypothetical protein BCR41DRAFT_205511 [Lobosporangium transversale]|eukprot:XP_021884534.1 hypothetical protein BCR41DRAFT_205511 [Lobosporangium transversale]